ncbi:MAG: MFS transporter [Anaerolineae bacterium]|nr:MFS transporter [Anaerolineae bacterium]
MNDLLTEQQQRDLRLARWYYFLLSGPALIAPYLNVFYTRLGITGTEIGTVAAVGSIVTLIVAPIWTGFGERWARPRLILQLALLVVAAGYLVLGLQHHFIGILITTACLALGAAAIAPFSDMLAMTIASSVKKGFGDIRVRASAGWVVFGIFGGLVIEHVEMYFMFIITALAYGGSVLTLLPIGSAHFSTRHVDNADKNVQYQFKTVLGNLMRHRPFIGLCLMLVVAGLTNAGIQQFENVFLSQLGASDGMLGILNVLGAAVEVPCMLWADRLMDRRMSAHRGILISMLMTAGIRLLVMIVPSVGMIVVERVIGGLAYSLFAIGLMRFVVAETLPHETRTVLALVNITIPSLINMLGSPLGGALYDSIGPRWLYPISALGYLLSWVALYFTRPRPETGAPSI